MAQCLSDTIRPDTYFGGAYLDWNQSKTAKVKWLTMFNHAWSLEQDVFHALACFLVYHRGTAACADNFLFNELAALQKGGVAPKLNTGLAEFADATGAETTFTMKVSSRALLTNFTSACHELFSIG